MTESEAFAALAALKKLQSYCIGKIPDFPRQECSPCESLSEEEAFAIIIAAFRAMGAPVDEVMAQVMKGRARSASVMPQVMKGLDRG